jgi:hypothetical protein
MAGTQEDEMIENKNWDEQERREFNEERTF